MTPKEKKETFYLSSGIFIGTVLGLIISMVMVYFIMDGQVIGDVAMDSQDFMNMLENWKEAEISSEQCMKAFRWLDDDINLTETIGINETQRISDKYQERFLEIIIQQEEKFKLIKDAYL